MSWQRSMVFVLRGALMKSAAPNCVTPNRVAEFRQSNKVDK